MLCFCQSWFWFLSSLLILQSCHGFYLPDSYPNKYSVGDPLFVKVNSLTSIDTLIPISYYRLPFCKPMEGAAGSMRNLGEFLMGDRIENSPYRFLMHTNETEIFLCQTDSLSADDFKVLTSRIDEMYQVNLNLEDLTVLRYTMEDDFFLRWTGYPVGIQVRDLHFVFNHLKFTVLIHKYYEKETNLARDMRTKLAVEERIPTIDNSGSDLPSYMVVGFEVVPCSYRHNANSVKKMKMYDKYPSPIRCDPHTVEMVAKQGQPLL